MYGNICVFSNLTGFGKSQTPNLPDFGFRFERVFIKKCEKKKEKKKCAPCLITQQRSSGVGAAAWRLRENTCTRQAYRTSLLESMHQAIPPTA